MCAVRMRLHAHGQVSFRVFGRYMLLHVLRIVGCTFWEVVRMVNVGVMSRCERRILE